MGTGLQVVNNYASAILWDLSVAVNVNSACVCGLTADVMI